MNHTTRIRGQYADNMMLAWQEAGIGEMMIQMEMIFAAALDADRLRRAIELLYHQHPLLGYRMVSDPQRPYWEPADQPEPDRPHLILVGEEDYRTFLTSDCQPTSPRQFEAALCNGSGGCRLALKVCHTLCDAGGVKELAYDLASLYSTLGHDPRHVPATTPPTARSGWQILKLLPWYAWLVLPWRFFTSLLRGPFPWTTITCPPPVTATHPYGYAVVHLHKERVKALADYGRARGATLNDLFITAIYRALAALKDPAAKGAYRLITTVDLRRWYLPSGRTSTPCNLSSFEYPYIGTTLGDTFDDTLRRVVRLTRKGKRWFPGLAPFPVMPLLERTAHHRVKKLFSKAISDARFLRNFPPGFTNMGPISPQSLLFDAKPPEHAWLLTPPMFPPLFTLGASGFAGEITFSAGEPLPSLPSMERFLRTMQAQLPQ